MEFSEITARAKRIADFAGMNPEIKVVSHHKKPSKKVRAYRKHYKVEQEYSWYVGIADACQSGVMSHKEKED